MTLHDRLVNKWNNCKLGLKQRVYNDEMPQASVQYIIKEPNYSDEVKMQWLIDTIDKHAERFEKEVKEMSNKIKSI